MGSDVDAVGAPLGHAFKGEALQGGRPAVGAEAFPLHVGVARGRAGGEIDLAVVVAAVGDEGVGCRVVDPLGLQRKRDSNGKDKQ